MVCINNLYASILISGAGEGALVFIPVCQLFRSHLVFLVSFSIFVSTNYFQTLCVAFWQVLLFINKYLRNWFQIKERKRKDGRISYCIIYPTHRVRLMMLFLRLVLKFFNFFKNQIYDLIKSAAFLHLFNQKDSNRSKSTKFIYINSHYFFFKGEGGGGVL